MLIKLLDQFGEQQLKQLSNVLIDCVEGGASVSFMLPMTQEKADTFWRKAFQSAQQGERFIFVAEVQGEIVGTVQLIVDLPENQPHRGDIAKMLVHRKARKHGLGAKLLAAAEGHAQKEKKSLLVLDTVTGTDAERMYVRQGWQRSGEIPLYAFWPDGRPCPHHLLLQTHLMKGALFD